MDFSDLIADFGVRHNVENILVIDGAASLDIDGIIVTIVSKEDVLTLSAEIGDPPAEGNAKFSNLLLEANMQSGSYFAKAPGLGPYFIVRRLAQPLIDGDSFDSALEAFVNSAETWRRILSDFRPISAEAAKQHGEASPAFGSSEYMQV